jgi:DNA-binding NtrC family response regulator
VPDLLDYFMRRESIRLSIAPRPFTHEALHTLQGWGWPGNVRELENLVKLVLATSRGDAVERDDLPVHLRASGTGAPAVGGGSGAFEGRTWEEMERGYARWLLEETGFNISRAARLAGLSRSTFDSRLRRLGIERGG